ncbi:FUSC family protein [Kitasatospora arboriphila]
MYNALADALEAVGTPAAEPARRALTAALDRADEALRLRALIRLPGSGRPAVDLRLAARLGTAAALCEAAVALLWEGEPLPARIADGPRRLAEAVRGDTVPGALPAPVSDTPARSAFDRAVLEAGVAFGAAAPGAPPPPARRPLVHPAGPAGREYGLRVAACVTVSTAVALLLHTGHWYWLPATAAFLVKPDLGPLFSRVVSRFASTAAGVLAFVPLAGLLTGRWWPSRGGRPRRRPGAARRTALRPADGRRHGDRADLRLGRRRPAGRGLPAGRHRRRLPAGAARRPPAEARRHPGAGRPPLRARPAAHPPLPAARAGRRAGRSRRASRRHPAGHAAEQRAELRRAAYQALAEARTAAETAAAELHTGRGPDWLGVTTGAERIVDAATACAVRLEHGAARPAAPAARRVAEALDAVADALDGRGDAPGSRPALADLPPDCLTLNDIVTELRRIRTLTTAA